MDEVIPTLEDLRSIFGDPTIGKIPDAPEIPVASIVTPHTEESVALTPNAQVTEEVKTITPELTDAEVAQRLKDAENSPEVASDTNVTVNNSPEVVKSGEEQTPSPQVVVIPPAIPQVVEQKQSNDNIIRDDKGRIIKAVAQDTNKNGNAGRPTVMTEHLLEKLREAFLFGCTDREACLFAEIDPKTLYNYQEEHPEYVQQKEDWKDHPKMLARKNVYDLLKKGDGDKSTWFLEHKANKEFSKRTQMTGGDGENAAAIKIEYVIPKSDK